MHESDLLKHIYARSADLSAAFPQVLAGPGHDCAVIAAPAGGSLLLKVDQLVEGVHFRGPARRAGVGASPAAGVGGTRVDLVARKALARAVSDIAAAGGTPHAALAAATLPGGCDYADDLFDAMSRWARHWRCPLVGGDVASWGRRAPSDEVRPALVLSLSVVGAPHARRGPVLRSGARPGDWVYVTGSLGGSFEPQTGLGRHLTFEPRLAEAAWLCDNLGGGLHAMMDLSDGLGRDASRLAAASGVRLEIEASRIPRAPGVGDWRRAAGDGEDYELLFTAGAEDPVPDRCPQTGTPFTKVGEVTAAGTAEAGCFILDEGVLTEARNLGWEHG